MDRKRNRFLGDDPHRPDGLTVLQLFATPDVLEQQRTLTDIRTLLEGYNLQEADDPDLMTQGVPRWVGKQFRNMASYACIVTAERKAIKVEIGAAGKYSIGIIAQDTNALGEQDRHLLMEANAHYPHNRSKRFQQLLDVACIDDASQPEKRGGESPVAQKQHWARKYFSWILRRDG